jgi:hypothetical protein
LFPLNFIIVYYCDFIGGGVSVERAMVFPHGMWRSARPWPHAKAPAKKEPAWAQSADRLAAGESLQSIALSKGVQISTIFGHILDSMLFSREVDFRALAAAGPAFSPPNEREWQALEEAAEFTGIDPVNVPSFIMKDLLMQVSIETVRGLFVEGKAREGLSEAEQALLNQWYNRIKWWQTLKRCDFVPDFEDESRSNSSSHGNMNSNSNSGIADSDNSGFLGGKRQKF